MPGNGVGDSQYEMIQRGNGGLRLLVSASEKGGETGTTTEGKTLKGLMWKEMSYLQK